MTEQREQFEKFMRSDEGLGEAAELSRADHTGEYCYSDEAAAWLAWQASRRAAFDRAIEIAESYNEATVDLIGCGNILSEKGMRDD